MWFHGENECLNTDCTWNSITVRECQFQCRIMTHCCQTHLLKTLTHLTSLTCETIQKMSEEGFTVNTLRQELSYQCFLCFWGILMFQLLIVCEFGKNQVFYTEYGFCCSWCFCWSQLITDIETVNVPFQLV